MKINELVQNVTLSGIKQSEINKAKIIPNAIMMDILGNKLYKYKIESTTRELLANAKDASDQYEELTGTPTKPIDVHIPTLLEPWFSIKDYGIGMDNETLEDVFFNYGASTKRDTNKYIGGFGIGAKTAGIYSNQYTVTSIKDGTKYTYQSFKNEYGEPCNVCLDISPTSEPNGTEIKIVANVAADFKVFESAVKLYGTWLDYPINCNKPIDFTKPKTEYTCNEFSITTLSNNAPIIVVGGIPYDFSWSSVNKSPESVAKVYSHFLIIYADIGEVDLIASREELEYTDKTKKFLEDRLITIKGWVDDYVKTKTKFWLFDNPQSWYSQSRYELEYGCTLNIKRRNKWINTSGAKSFKKYVKVADLEKKIQKSYIASKLGLDTDNIAFVNRANEPDLLKIGVPKDRLVDIDDIPRRKSTPRTGHRVLYIRNNGDIGFTRKDDITGKTFNIHDSRLSKATWDSSRRYNCIKRFIEDGVIITANPSEPDTLIEWVKKEYKTDEQIKYDDISTLLEKMDFIKRTHLNKKIDNLDILEIFGLLSKKEVSYHSTFPLLRGVSGQNYYFSGSVKEHAKKYVKMILKEDPKALESPYVEVL